MTNAVITVENTPKRWMEIMKWKTRTIWIHVVNICWRCMRDGGHSLKQNKNPHPCCLRVDVVIFISKCHLFINGHNLPYGRKFVQIRRWMATTIKSKETKQLLSVMRCVTVWKGAQPIWSERIKQRHQPPLCMRTLLLYDTHKKKKQTTKCHLHNSIVCEWMINVQDRNEVYNYYE